MVARNIELDEDAIQILDSMANVHGGSASLAISELLRTHEAIESLLDELEAGQNAELAVQKEVAERDFREGRFTPWNEVKRQNGL